MLKQKYDKTLIFNPKNNFHNDEHHLVFYNLLKYVVIEYKSSQKNRYIKGILLIIIIIYNDFDKDKLDHFFFFFA